MSPMHPDHSTTVFTSRRSFLKALGVAGAVTIVGSAGPSMRPLTAWAMQGAADTVLVSVFLRGGADGIGIVTPGGDDALYTLRPTLAVPPSQLLDLDGFFGLDPIFAALQSEFSDGRLAFVHATGAPSMSRSHFDAQPLLDRADGAGGWLQRALFAGSFGQFAAGLTIGSRVSPPLAGPWAGSVVLSVEQTAQSGMQLAQVRTPLEDMYGATEYVREREAMVGSLVSIDQFESAVPTTGEYPTTATGFRLREAAGLIKADVGVRGVALDAGGWDSHRDQQPQLTRVGTELSEALQAFQADLGTHAQRVVTVVMSEFGRTARENASSGTDHGRGSLMMVLGEPLVGQGGGQVHLTGAWPGLAPGDLDISGPGGGLQMTTDFRHVLSELVSSHLGIPNVGGVFPGHSPTPLGLLAAPPQVPGDVDQSGTVDDQDVTAILSDLSGDTPAQYTPAVGDLDGDGDTDLRDALLLAQQLQG